MAWILIMVLMLLVSPTHAVFHDFDNCLPESIVSSHPLLLQFVPLRVSVAFNSDDPPHGLSITVYGNVSGTTDPGTPYPPPDAPQWSDPNSTFGKIEDLSRSNNKYSTLLTKIDVLSYSPYSHASRFCKSVVQGHCPLAPVFDADL